MLPHLEDQLTSHRTTASCTVEMTANDVTSITNVQDVASYSWLNSEDPDVVETPKIAVPGKFIVCFLASH